MSLMMNEAGNVILLCRRPFRCGISANPGPVRQRTLRGENELIRKELGRMAGAMVSRDTLSEVLTVLVDRIANFEALIEARFDGLTAQISRLVPQ